MDSEIEKTIIIKQTSNHNTEFAVKDLEWLSKNSGTKKIFIDDSVSKKRQIQKYLSHNDRKVLIGKDLELSDGCELERENNPYPEICETEDYSKVRKAKLQNWIILTSDYGQFVCATIESVEAYYCPNDNQLRRGIRYFLYYTFPKKIKKIIWHFLKKLKI